MTIFKVFFFFTVFFKGFKDSNRTMEKLKLVKKKIFTILLFSFKVILFPQTIAFQCNEMPWRNKNTWRRIKSVHIKLLSLKNILFPQFIAFQCHCHCHFVVEVFEKKAKDVTPIPSLCLPVQSLLGFYCYCGSGGSGGIGTWAESLTLGWFKLSSNPLHK